MFYICFYFYFYEGASKLFRALGLEKFLSRLFDLVCVLKLLLSLAHLRTHFNSIVHICTLGVLWSFYVTFVVAVFYGCSNDYFLETN